MSKHYLFGQNNERQDRGSENRYNSNILHMQVFKQSGFLF